jgi:hypothetical protein
LNGLELWIDPISEEEVGFFVLGKKIQVGCMIVSLAKGETRRKSHGHTRLPELNASSPSPFGG